MRFIRPLPSSEKHEAQSDGSAPSNPHVSRNCFWRHAGMNWGSGKPTAESSRTVKPGAVIAWCGMRGIVTLATALALPETFPYRGLILFCAYSVVLVTLVVQGVALTQLLHALK